MNKNPILIFTGLAVAAVAGVAGLTKDRWAPPAAVLEAPAKPVEQATAPAVEQPAVTTEAPAKAVEQAAAPATEQPAVPTEAPAKTVEQQQAAAPAVEPPAVTPEAPAKAVEQQQAAAPAVEPPAVIAEAPAKTVEQPQAAVPAPQQPQVAAVPVTEPPAIEPPATPTVPTFDTVRVEKTGEAVIAGRADAGSEVVIKLDGQAIGTATANDEGSFVVVPEQPLPVGSGALTIEAKTDKQPIATASEQTVAVIVPEQGKQEVLVAVVSPDAPTRVLQKPEPEKTEEQQSASAAPAATEQPAAEPPAAEQPIAAQPATEQPVTQLPAAEQPAATQPAAEQPVAEQPAAEQPAAPAAAKPRLVSLDAVDYDPAGNIVFSGQGQAGTGARLYVDNAFAGDAAVAADGHWTFSGTTSVAAGVHALRVDGVGTDGKVINRIEVPFFREETTKVAAAAPVAEPPAVEQPAAKTDVQIAAAEPVAPAPPATAAIAPAKPKDGRVVIQPGNNLWRISKVIYGSGVKYTLLYEANKDQIRDADMIYPGQVFKTPDVVPPESIDPHRRDPLVPASGQ